MSVFLIMLVIFFVLLGISYYLALEAIETWALRRKLEIVDASLVFGEGHRFGEDVTRHDAEGIFLTFRVKVHMTADPEKQVFHGLVRVPSMSLGSHNVDERWDAETPGVSLLAIQDRERAQALAPEPTPLEAQELEIRAEIARRLDALSGPAILAHDLDGDGQVDSEEWELARRQIEAEVRASFQAPAETDPPESGPEGTAW